MCVVDNITFFSVADNNSINRMLSNSNQPGTGKKISILCWIHPSVYGYTIYSWTTVRHLISRGVGILGFRLCGNPQRFFFFCRGAFLLLFIIPLYHSDNNNNTPSGKGQYQKRGTWPKTLRFFFFSSPTIGVGFGHHSNGNESKTFVTFSLYTVETE